MVVETTVGVEGLDLQAGVDAAIADDVPAFANACIELLRDDARAEALRVRGRTIVAQYGWSVIGRRAADALGRLL